MNCPRTGTPLKEIEIDGVVVDFSEACGGVWFDNFELGKFDEISETGGEALARMMDEHQNEDINLEQRLKCPRDGAILMRHFFSPARKIEVDECPQCGGIWLDGGELTSIRDLFPTEEEREKAGEAFVEDVFKGTDAASQMSEAQAFKHKASRVASIFRWLSPSRYIPGKQDWGNY